MRLLWLDINASYSHSSLALPALHSQLEESLSAKFEWKVISGTINSDSAIILLDIIDYNPDIILSTAWLFNHNYILNLLSKFKSINSFSTVILGGPEFLGNNSEYLKSNKFVNAVFKGEGEEIFPLLLNTLFERDSLDKINGICLINTAGDYLENDIAEVSSFETLNPPEVSRFFSWEKPFIQIETSRGCFNTCSFCISGGCRKIQDISISKLRERLEFVVSKGIKEIRVLDRTFNANAKRATELLNLFSDFSGLLKFHLEIHPAFINDQIKSALKSTPVGLLHLEAGIQSLDDNVLFSAKRIGNSKKSLEGIKYLISLKKFEIHVDLIAGLPKYSFAGLINDMKRLIPIGVEEIQIELLKLLPGTKLREESSLMNITFSKNPPYEVLCTQDISAKELYYTTILSKLIDNWHNNQVWRETFREIFQFENNLIELFLSHLIRNKILNTSLSLESKGIIFYDFCNIFIKEAAPLVSYSWIKAGLSLKKGPGKVAKQWIRGVSVEDNPILDLDNQYLIYYYIKEPRLTAWFSFDKREKKDKPVNISRT